MGRTAAFDPDEKLQQAMKLFWQKGYRNTSLQDLVTTLGINRFSLYNTFGDKHQLYIQALSLYLERVTRQMMQPLKADGDGKQRLDRYLINFGEKLSTQPGELGCMAQGAGLEFGRKDSAVTQHLEVHYGELEREMVRALQDAREAGQLHRPDLDIAATALHLLVAVQGLIMMRKVLHDRKRTLSQIEFLRAEVQRM